MSDSRDSRVLDDVRRALGRTQPLREPPVPPAILEPITRLVHTDLGLPELWSKVAGENKIDVESVYVDELAAKLTEFFTSRGIRRVGASVSPLFEKLGLLDALRIANVDVKTWGELTLDEAYELDAGLTDAYAAVAEVGGIVVRGNSEHGRSLSLVPPVHVCILEPKVFVPDLVDLFEKLTKEGVGSGTVIITGPSKTADIEMNLVTGVHGPGVVKAYVLG